MHRLSDKTLISVLHRDYPHIVSKITDDINAVLPKQKLTDLKQIGKIVEAFKREKQIEVLSFKNERGEKKVTQVRQLLIAVIILFYDPERLVSNVKRVRFGVINSLSKYTNTPVNILSNSLATVIVNLKVYESFKNEVYSLYDLINEEYKFFNQPE